MACFLMLVMAASLLPGTAANLLPGTGLTALAAEDDENLSGGWSTAPEMMQMTPIRKAARECLQRRRRQANCR